MSKQDRKTLYASSQCCAWWARFHVDTQTQPGFPPRRDSKEWVLNPPTEYSRVNSLESAESLGSSDGDGSGQIQASSHDDESTTNPSNNKTSEEQASTETPDIMTIGEELLCRSCIFFELNSTLCDTRKASQHALTTVFGVISHNFGIPFETLRIDYRSIMAEMKPLAAATAFDEGQGPLVNEYRKDRFATLLARHRVPASFEYLNLLNRRYKKALVEQLHLRPGALDLIRYLRRIGKCIVLIADCTRETHEWTARQLGLLPYVRFLCNSSEWHKTRAEGLLADYLHSNEIPATEVVYVGSSEERDMVPARGAGAGVLAVKYDEAAAEASLGEGEDNHDDDDYSKLCINKLSQLLDVMVATAEGGGVPQAQDEKSKEAGSERSEETVVASEGGNAGTN